ncbi:MAG: 30S ribosomal protein S20 [Oscillospiraceae bacterium]|nr:30S ribosomal protein S20 [Oscillospiraceae bacterium]
MPNIKSAKKRVRVTKVKYERNKARRSEMKTVLKKAKADGAAHIEIHNALRMLDKAAGKGIIHRNKAARLKSKLAKKQTASA